MGSGEDPESHYRSHIYYQNKNPKWNEVVKVLLLLTFWIFREVDLHGKRVFVHFCPFFLEKVRVFSSAFLYVDCAVHIRVTHTVIY